MVASMTAVPQRKSERTWSERLPKQTVHDRAIEEAQAQLRSHEWRYDDDKECPCEKCDRAKAYLKAMEAVK